MPEHLQRLAQAITDQDLRAAEADLTAQVQRVIGGLRRSADHQPEPPIPDLRPWTAIAGTLDLLRGLCADFGGQATLAQVLDKLEAQQRKNNG